MIVVMESSFESTESISKIKEGSNSNIHVWFAKDKKDMICYKENLPSDFQSENYLTEVEVNNQGDAHNSVYKSFLKDLLTKSNYGIAKN